MSTNRRMNFYALCHKRTLLHKISLFSIATTANKQTNKQKRRIKELSDCNEISYAKIFEQKMQIIKIYCPMSELRELKHIGTTHSAGPCKEVFPIY